jgi:putative tryptophan/tyrosine transport system substrate-binding protein
VFGKSLATLKELAPAVNRIAVLHTGQSDNIGMLHAVEVVAQSLGVAVTAAEVHDAAAIERAVEALADHPNGGLVVTPNLVTQRHRELIFKLATRHKLPAAYPYRNFVADGGLVSYGPDPADHYRGAASYVDRILRGEKAADLPVQQPNKYELVVNLRAAKSIGLSIPESFLARADEVIE